MNRIYLFGGVALLLLLAGCKDSESDVKDVYQDASILQYVPADTPYLYASVAPVPVETYEALRPTVDGLLNSLSAIISMAMELPDDCELSADTAALTYAADGEDEGEACDAEDVGIDEDATALLTRFQTYLSTDALEEVGIDRLSTMAVYGHGFRPVMRISSASPDKLQAAILGFVTEAGGQVDQAKIDGQSYTSVAAGELAVILALQEEFLVITAVEPDIDESVVRALLGVEKPALSIAQSRRLEEMAQRAGYLPYGAGYVDIQGTLSRLLDDEAQDSMVSGLLEDELGSGALIESAACRQELLELTDVMPLYRFGMTELTGNSLTAEYMLELRSDIALDLSKITAPVPGLHEDMGGLFFLGMSFDLFAARDFALARIEALEAGDYQCEMLAGFAEMAVSAKETILGPMPPMVSSVKGFSFAIDSVGEINIEDPASTVVHGRMVAAMDNPLSLLAMSGMFVPALASVPLEANGLATQLPEGSIPFVTEPVFVAVSESAVALSIGSADGETATSLLNTAPAPVPPLYAYGVDLGAVFRLILQAAELSPEEIPADEQVVLALMESMSRLDVRYVEAMRFAESGVQYDIQLSF